MTQEITTQEKVRVLIVEDHALVREELRRHLSRHPHIEIAGDAADGATAVERATALEVSLVLMDLRMPGLDSMEAIRRIKAARPDVRVLVLTVHGDVRHVREAREAGADGYILKGESPAKLLRAMFHVAAGGTAFLHDETSRD